MIYLLIIGVMFLALAPLWHFAPSKRQRRQALLRETAALSGLFVEFRDLPLPAARLERLHSADRQLLYYGCRLPSLRGEPLKTVSWYRDKDDWGSMPPRQKAPEILQQMPDSVLALALSQASCGLFWHENGDAAQVTEFARLLAAWRDAIVEQRS